jgi:hypothetical protein
MTFEYRKSSSFNPSSTRKRMTYKNYPFTSYLINQQGFPFYVLTFLPLACGAFFMAQALFM